MKRSELEKYLGKPVRIKLFNGRIEEGYLHKTGEEKYKYNPNLYFPKNSYFTVDSESSITCNSYIFYFPRNCKRSNYNDRKRKNLEIHFRCRL